MHLCKFNGAFVFEKPVTAQKRALFVRPCIFARGRKLFEKTHHRFVAAGRNINAFTNNEDRRAEAEPSHDDHDKESRLFAVACAEEADMTKCLGVRVLHVAPLVSWTSYMVFATVFSKPQLLAALARIEMMAGERFSDRIKQNVPGSSPWECLDFGDVVVHVMTADQREWYNVEQIYAAAKEVDLPFLEGIGSAATTDLEPTQPTQPTQPLWMKG